jgi:polysaccharide pyruvyl transferase WcaK-like protein
MDVARYHALLANAADFMVDRLSADVVFVPMEPSRQDLQHSHAVVSQMHWPQRATVLKGEYGSGQLLSLMGRFEMALGMRLHFLIFAALAGIPFVALPYASKVEGFLAELDMAMPPLEHVSAGQLLAYLDRSWDARDRARAQLKDRLPALQQRARRTHRLLLELLGLPVVEPACA